MRFLALWFLSVALSAQSVALTFDDGFNPRTQAQAKAWNAAMLRTLAQEGVSAALFPAGRSVDSAEGLALVRAWGDHGHRVGNHTYSHQSLAAATTSLAAFEADVLRNEALLKSSPGWTPRLRFPFLKEGDTAEKRDGFRAWMSAHGYRPAPVSIDASDWYYSVRFQEAETRAPGALTAKFRRAYLDHLWDRATYYDGLARRVLGRSPKHVLLLHTNAINAAFLSDVIHLFRSRGWTLISPEEAFADPLYELRPTALPAGESLLWSLAKQRGVEGLRYPAEDDVYEQPILEAAGL
jgi:peptidoglycan/xylan/chitin deacetylase (PgdA/CDA1 family)